MRRVDAAITPERKPAMPTACSPTLATVHRRRTKPSQAGPRPSGAHVTAVPRANCIDSPWITTLTSALASMIDSAPLRTSSSASGGGMK